MMMVLVVHTATHARLAEEGWVEGSVEPQWNKIQ
jgi:hypothetical protein